jgi:hypothetical protein
LNAATPGIAAPGRKPGRDVELAERGIVINHNRQIARFGNHAKVALVLELAAAPVIRRDDLLRVVTHLARDGRVLQRLQRGGARGHRDGADALALAGLFEHDFEDAGALLLIEMQEFSDAGSGDDAGRAFIDGPFYFSAQGGFVETIIRGERRHQHRDNSVCEFQIRRSTSAPI